MDFENNNQVLVLEKKPFRLKKLLITLLTLCVIVVIGCFVSGSASAFSGGSGTENDPYKITNQNDWKDISNNKDKNWYYRLTADFKISSFDYLIWNGSFRGNIDGNDKTITMDVTNGNSWIAPIADANGATIKNLNVTGKISGGGLYVGGICGAANNTIIVNCHNYATINGSERVGGICGYAGNTTTIINCKNRGNINGSKYVGGVCGYLDSGTIEKCCSEVGSNYGVVTSADNSEFIGGLCGYNGPTTHINDCYVAGLKGTEMQIKGSHIALVCGCCAGFMKNCFCYGVDNSNGIWVLDGGYKSGSDWDHDRDTKYKNCYSCVNTAHRLNCDDNRGRPIGVAKKTEEEFRNGTACYALDSSGTVFSQKIDIGQVKQDDIYDETKANIEVYPRFINDKDRKYVKSDKTYITYKVYKLSDGKYYNNWHGIDVKKVAPDDIGTEGKPYKIESIEDLRILSCGVSKNLPGYNENDKYYKVINGLTGTTAYDVLSIGTNSHPFEANFDGNNKTITYGNLTARGLFTSCKNNTLKNITVSGNISFPSGTCSGGICGYMESGVISGCVSKAKISGKNQYAGGIVGMAKNSKVSNCTNYSNLAQTDICGGICGEIQGSGEVRDCTNYESKLSVDYNYAGGICGCSYVPIINCTNKATIEAKGGWSGGIVGTYRSEESLSGCKNYGAVLSTNGTEKIGGICGESQTLDTTATKTATIADCFNYANVTAEKATAVGGIAGIIEGEIKNSTTTTSTTITVKGKDTVGGICGQAKKNISECSTSNVAVVSTGDNAGGIVGVASENVLSCKNSNGTVKSDKNNVGGIAGNAIGNINNCSIEFNQSSEAVNGKFNIGGICGKSNGSVLECSNYKADGVEVSVTGEQSVGGIVGSANVVDGCTNSFGVTCKDSTNNWNFGGICGQASGVISGCTNGNVVISGKNRTGGICGYSTSSINNCKNESIEISGGNDGECIAGICGQCVADGSAKILECKNNYQNVTAGKGVIKGKNFVGGICGSVNGADISSCSNDVPDENYIPQIEATGDNVGGICGFTDGRILMCSNGLSSVTDGSSTATPGVKIKASGNNVKYVGGICGKVATTKDKQDGATANNKFRIDLCQNTGKIEAGNAEYVGGICGEIEYFQITSCKVAYDAKEEGENVVICGKSYVGGVCGSNLNGLIINSYKIATQYYTENIEGDGKSTVKATGDYVGGICGNIVEKGVIENCYQLGIVSGTSLHVGGICGEDEDGIGKIYTCYSSSNYKDATDNSKPICGGTPVDGVIENCAYEAATTGSEESVMTAFAKTDVSKLQWYLNKNNKSTVVEIAHNSWATPLTPDRYYIYFGELYDLGQLAVKITIDGNPTCTYDGKKHIASATVLDYSRPNEKGEPKKLEIGIEKDIIVEGDLEKTVVGTYNIIITATGKGEIKYKGTRTCTWSIEQAKPTTKAELEDFYEFTSLDASVEYDAQPHGVTVTNKFNGRDEGMCGTVEVKYCNDDGEELAGGKKPTNAGIYYVFAKQVVAGRDVDFQGTDKIIEIGTIVITPKMISPENISWNNTSIATDEDGTEFEYVKFNYTGKQCVPKATVNSEALAVSSDECKLIVSGTRTMPNDPVDINNPKKAELYSATVQKVNNANYYLEEVTGEERENLSCYFYIKPREIEYEINVEGATVSNSEYTLTYDAQGHTVDITTTNPTNAKVEYLVDGEYTEKMTPLITAFSWKVEYKISSPTYGTVYNSAILNIEKASIENSVTVKDYIGDYDAQSHQIEIKHDLPAKDDVRIWYGLSATQTDLEDPVTRTDVSSTQVFYKISSTNYTELTGSAYIIIKNAKIRYTCDAYSGVWDGNGHTLKVTTTNVAGADIKYVWRSERLDNPPTFTDIGTYSVAYEISYPNYETVYGTAYVNIRKPDISFEPDVYIGEYDGDLHPVIRNKLSSDKYKIRFKNDDGTGYVDDVPEIKDVGEKKVHYQVYTKKGENEEVILQEEIVTAKVTKCTLTADWDENESRIVYDKEVHTPTVTLYKAGSLKPVTQTVIVYKADTTEVCEAKNVGEYDARVTLEDSKNYTVNNDIFRFQISPKTILTRDIQWSGSKVFDYNGSEQKPTVKVSDWTKDEQYIVEATNTNTGEVVTPINAGKYTASVKVIDPELKNNYELPADEMTCAFEIKPLNLVTSGKTGKIEVTCTSLEYTGKEQEVKETVIFKVNDESHMVLERGKDYTVSGNTGTQVGDYTLKVEGKGNFDGIIEAQWSISAPKAKIATEPKAKTNLTYKYKYEDNKFTPVSQELIEPGTSSEGTLMYSLDKKTWSEALPTASDVNTYSVYYYVKSNENNRTDSDIKSLSVTINKGDCSHDLNRLLSCDEKSLEYSGVEQKASVSSKVPQQISSEDITVAYYKGSNFIDEVSPKDAGIYTVRAKIKNSGNSYFEETNYVTVGSYEITQKDISKCNYIAISQTPIQRTGDMRTFEFRMENGTTKLTENIDYVVSGTRKAKESGKYSFTIKGTGNYTGETEKKEWEIAEKYTITVKQPNNGGKITADNMVDNKIVVKKGDSVTLTAVADDAWVLSTFTVDGVATDDTDGNTLKLSDISQDQEISAVFKDKISYIIIAKQPTKTTYKIGEALDISGLEVQAVDYRLNKLALDLNYCTISPLESSSSGDKSISITYKTPAGTELTTNFIVTVMEEEKKEIVTNLTITRQPSKTQYTIGEELDENGLEVVAYVLNEDGSSTKKVLNKGEYTLSGFDSNTAGTKTVTVEYKGQQAKFNVVVIYKEAGWSQNGNGKWQYIQNGFPLTGWHQLPYDNNNKVGWFYFNQAGEMQIGWQNISGYTYYLDPETGAMCTNWKMIDGKWYYFNESYQGGTEGIMRSGWILAYDGHEGSTEKFWYYCDAKDGLVTGWLCFNGGWYYLRPDWGGALLTNGVTPEGYRVDQNGKVIV